MLELTLVRHASTRLNEERRYQGHGDVPLSARGEDEARRLASRLRRLRFDYVLCSDLCRCVRTLELALPGHRPRREPRLREIDFGAWDGLTWDECHALDPDLLGRWMERPEETTPPDGEPFASFCERVDSVVHALGAGGAALMVVHGGPIRRITAHALGLTWRQVASMELSPGGITRLALHLAGGHLRSWNDTAHLEHALREPRPHE